MKAACLAVVLSLFLIFSAMPSFAADWPPISPDDLAMTSIKEQPGAPAVVLLREETDDDMNNHHSVYMRVKILTEAGREYANVQLPYNRRGFKITDISGRTVHADGSIVPFTGKPFDRTVLKSSGSRVNVKSFTLPDVQVGSIIDYRYSLGYDDNRLVPPEWDVQTDLFQRKVTFKFIPFQNHGSVEIMLPHDQVARGIAWAPFLGDGPQPQLHTVPRSGISAATHEVSMWVDLSRENISPLLDEPYMVPSSITKMRVYFYYQEARNVEDYWKMQHKFWDKDVSSFIGKDKGVREQVAQLVAAKDSPEQKVRKIYAFITTLENQDYIPQRTAQENQLLQLKPDKGAEDVLAHRSGTHDDLNRLFVAMVRAAGIPASLIWVPDRSNEIFVKQYLSTNQFDAEIAIVQLDGKDVYLDPGSKFCPYGIIDWRYTSVGGLRQGSTEFGETPALGYQQSISTRNADVALDDHGMIDGVVTLVFKGIAAMTRRQEGGKTDAEGRKKMLEDELRSQLPGNSQVTLLNSPDWNGVETALVAQFRVRCPFAVAAGKHLMLMQHLFQTDEKPRFPAAQRANAVLFRFPWQEADEVHIKLPPDMKLDSLAPDDSVSLPYALYKVRQKQEAPDRIFSRRDFVMGTTLIPVDQYKEVKTFFDKVASDDGQPALVRLSQSVAAPQ
jgi:Domain of Unknown Function with PDB structure (DUF3857)/Transglutaminase-like superfamily